MGLPMATNLAVAGHRMLVWNRSRAKADEYVTAHQATAANTPAEAASDADVVISMLADDAAVLEALTGDNGVTSTLQPGTIVIDMSTISPETVRRLAAAVERKTGKFIDAPVSGSVTAATEASLTIMAAGPRDAVEAVRPLLSAMGSPVLHLGPSGNGAAMKLVVNTVVHSLNGAVSEALVLAERAGIERTMAYDVLLNSAAAAPFVHDRRASFERPWDVPVTFRLALAAKDLRLALALGQQSGAILPQTETNLTMLEVASAGGFADQDETILAEFYRSEGGHQ